MRIGLTDRPVAAATPFSALPSADSNSTEHFYMVAKLFVDAKTNEVYVSDGYGNKRVAVIDAKTFEVVNYILVGQRPWHLEFDPDGTKLYVANGLTNDMTVIDVASQKAEKSVPVGRLPWGVAVMP